MKNSIGSLRHYYQRLKLPLFFYQGQTKLIILRLPFSFFEIHIYSFLLIIKKPLQLKERYVLIGND